jgi:putative membrane protein
MTIFPIFVAIALLSIIANVEFLSWRGAQKDGRVPAISARKLRLVTAVIRGEFLAIVIVLPCAVIMVRGELAWIFFSSFRGARYREPVILSV